MLTYYLKHPVPVQWQRFKVNMEIWLAAENKPDAQQGLASARPLVMRALNTGHHR